MQLKLTISSVAVLLTYPVIVAKKPTVMAWKWECHE